MLGGAVLGGLFILFLLGSSQVGRRGVLIVAGGVHLAHKRLNELGQAIGSGRRHIVVTIGMHRVRSGFGLLDGDPGARTLRDSLIAKVSLEAHKKDGSVLAIGFLEVVANLKMCKGGHKTVGMEGVPLGATYSWRCSDSKDDRRCTSQGKRQRGQKS